MTQAFLILSMIALGFTAGRSRARREKAKK